MGEPNEVKHDEVKDGCAAAAWLLLLISTFTDNYYIGAFGLVWALLWLAIEIADARRARRSR